MKICIIGGGPTGCFAGYKLAKHFQIDIYENHSQIGTPVQCSGLVTQTIKKIDPIFLSKEFDKVIKNEINHVRLFSKNEMCEILLKEPDIVLNREKFDKWLAKLAEKQGAKFHFNSEFIKFESQKGKKDIILHIKQKGKVKKVKTDILIGADGFFSKVSKGLGNTRDFIPCMQADMNYKGKTGTMDIFFSEEYKELFAWIVPKNNKVAEIGLGCKEDTAKKFTKFIKEQKIKGKPLQHTGGPITMYNPNQKIANGKVFLVGEAATLVKASTLGGIISSLRSVNILANYFIKGQKYEDGIKSLKREMHLHYLSRRLLDKFSDRDYDLLLKLCNNKKVKELFAKHSRDEYSRKSFLLKLIIAQPKFAGFIFKLIN